MEDASPVINADQQQNGYTERAVKSIRTEHLTLHLPK